MDAVLLVLILATVFLPVCVVCAGAFFVGRNILRAMFDGPYRPRGASKYPKAHMGAKERALAAGLARRRKAEAASIMDGLQDALAHSKGDTSRGREVKRG